MTTHTDEKHANGTQIDPVCGMTVNPESPHRHVHEGVEHLFCSASCKEKFSADPGRYLNPESGGSCDGHPSRSHEHEHAHDAPPGTPYTCPMDPEIEQEGPGSCPKCGDLVGTQIPQ